MRPGVQIRLMGDDQAAVRAAVERLQAVLGEELTITGEAPNRRGPGLRVYAAMAISTTAAKESRLCSKHPPKI